MSKTIFVYENWSNENPLLIGRLFVDTSKKDESYSFEYDSNWLKSSSVFQIDPDLSLYSGRQFTQIGKRNFGVFSDSCPDRWGRLLMQRKEAVYARKENRKPNKLRESDYLLGVYDQARMGALRFSLDGGIHFESCDANFATPPYVELRSLEAASLVLENDETGLNESVLNKLLAPGSSLGGARPKATVKDVDGSLWIAKFPSKNDIYNVGAWEKVVHDLAVLCNLNVPEARLENYSSNGSTFLVKRFDRDGSRRIHFASAMTLLGKEDGVENISYLDIVSFIKSFGNNPKKDLLELWNRIVFNMAVSNTDDHLRNHGFILRNKGWELSPLFDVNPIPYGNSLSLFVDDVDSSIDFDLAINTAPLYGINKEEAKDIVSFIKSTVNKNLEHIAKQCGIGRDSIEYMRPAFQL